MPRTKGSKNKNTATAKNKNIININVNSSKSKKGRPRKTTANTNTQARYPNYGGGNANAPPQVIISQPQADNSNLNNSLISSFITSKILNETMNRSNMTAVEPPRAEPTIAEPPRPESSYFTARESIIPKLPDTPKTVIKPSPKIETKKPTTITEPPKIDIKPDDVSPPKTDIKPIDVSPPKKTPPKFYKKLVDDTKNNTSQLSSSVLEDAMKEVKEENNAATLIKSVLSGHRNRKMHSLRKQYPELVNKRLELVKEMDPQNLLQYKPKIGDDGKPLYLQKLEGKKAKDKIKLEQTLLSNPIISQDLENKTLKNKTAIKIQNAIRGKLSRNKAADLYIQKQDRDKEEAVKKIQSIYRGKKTRNELINDKDFQNKIDIKIKKYGDAASEYATRGKDSEKVNQEFSDIMKNMRTGLQKFRTTLGTKPKKRGPKPKVND
jgi:hypothetical protein